MVNLKFNLKLREVKLSLYYYSCSWWAGGWVGVETEVNAKLSWSWSWGWAWQQNLLHEIEDFFSEKMYLFWTWSVSNLVQILLISHHNTALKKNYFDKMTLNWTFDWINKGKTHYQVKLGTFAGIGIHVYNDPIANRVQ